jgi:predicted RNA-binding Zn ribbon-like protein
MPRRLGGLLALDFINTVDPRHAALRREYLPDYAALVEWAAYAGALEPPAADRLRSAASSQASSATAVHRRALALREASYRAIAAHLHSRQASATDLGSVSREIAKARAGQRLEHDGRAFRLGHLAPGQPLDTPLCAVALSMGELLVSVDLGRVRECPGEDGCGWLFLDASRNGGRRWCSMQVCGNRAKVRRHQGSERV